MPDLFERCVLCNGTQRIPPDAKLCDYPAHLGGACLCTQGPTPGWIATGLTSGQFDVYRRKMGEAIEEASRLRQAHRDLEDQLVWLSDWCKRITGVENNKVIGRDGWPHRLCEVVARAVEADRDKLRRLLARLLDHFDHVSLRPTAELVAELREAVGNAT